ncbi:uncharacterized protein LOC117106184 isoform X2 [Anneissia japonica]|uniref:uncharacterized protein LOC117106184 isoform X2 n=1 Tax=Anneissia japonica TaxID=1529436 RepID=UPI001425AF6B|nr:uncharacterized protein LOC117106184 isoform X2 [Anneissia japonica]
MKRGLKMCTIEKIRVKGSRPGRITKSKAVRNLFGTTPNDHDSWLKQELEQAFLQDRKKMESLGLDPDTGMPAENNTSRWEWTAVDENSCPKIYRSKDILSGFVNLSTNSSTSIVFSSENNRLLDTVARNNIVCSTTTTSTNTSTVNQDASQTPKQYKQTTITGE